MKYFLKHIVLFFVTVTFFSANGSLVSASNNRLNPKLTVFHESPDTSVVYISIQSGELLYTRQNAGSEFTSCVKIKYTIYNPGTRIPADTGSMVIRDTGNKNNKNLIITKKIKLKSGVTYESEFLCKDMNRDEENKLKITINKQNPNHYQYFLLMNEKNQPIFSNTTSEKIIWLAYPRYKDETLFIRYYNRKFSTPSPPFAENKIEKFSYRSDSVSKVNLNDSGYVKLVLQDHGFYHFQHDTTTQEGFSLFIYSGEFPEITLKSQLAEPLRYLTSSTEFEKINNSPDPKKEVDAFWLDKCGSKERAKETIKQYYGRVEFANKNYTSFTEGWKTDRGMISVIFGEPHSKTIGEDSEIWYYNNDRAYSYISFTFLKIQNPFSDNDYILTRDPGFKPQWYKAIESWRQGRAYNANNF